jgi:predicted RNase H-like HicB family nuclease/predicted RNA binding protein YcfA (HicA-like mRNA interferase family)
MKVRDVVKAMEKDGWLLDRTRGDHRQYIHPNRPEAGTVTVPGHPRRRNAIRDAKLDTEEGRVEEMKRYAVVFEKAAHNWAAYVPDLPGCVTTGRTLEETRRLIAEAIEFHIEGMRLHSETVPEPTTVAETVEIQAA